MAAVAHMTDIVAVKDESTQETARAHLVLCERVCSGRIDLFPQLCRDLVHWLSEDLPLDARPNDALNHMCARAAVLVQNMPVATETPRETTECDAWTVMAALVCGSVVAHNLWLGWAMTVALLCTTTHIKRWTHAQLASLVVLLACSTRAPFFFVAL